MLDEEIKRLLSNPKAAALLLKLMEGEKAKSNPLTNKTKVAVEVEHHYHCRLCGVTTIRVYEVQCINSNPPPVHQDTNYCESCPDTFDAERWSKKEIVERAIRIISELGRRGNGKG